VPGALSLPAPFYEIGERSRFYANLPARKYNGMQVAAPNEVANCSYRDLQESRRLFKGVKRRRQK
jgi:hypothetical protein